VIAVPTTEALSIAQPATVTVPEIVAPAAGKSMCTVGITAAAPGVGAWLLEQAASTVMAATRHGVTAALARIKAVSMPTLLHIVHTYDVQIEPIGPNGMQPATRSLFEIPAGHQETHCHGGGVLVRPSLVRGH
jgi:hypothetical protein